MAYTDPTTDDFFDAFSEFDPYEYSEDEVQKNIDLGRRQVDQTWIEADYARAILLYAAHMLDSGDTSQSSDGGQRVSSINISAGSVSTSFDTKGELGALSSTRYGTEFERLRRLNRGGPRVTGDL